MGFGVKLDDNDVIMIEKLEQHIRDLERRIRELERQFEELKRTSKKQQNNNNDFFEKQEYHPYDFVNKMCQKCSRYEKCRAMDPECANSKVRYC